LRSGAWVRAAFRIATLAWATGFPLAAWAEISNDSMLGLGLRSRPAYEGSASQRLEVVPVIRYFGEPWFVRSTQAVLEAGLRGALAPGLHAGVQLAYEPGRQASESDFLERRHVADVKRGASLGAHLEWDHMFGPMPVTLLARARKHVDTALGAQADLRLSAGMFQSGPVGAGLFAQATWADAKSSRSLYGIEPQASISSGLPVFTPRSGWLFTSAGLLWSVELSPKWVVVGSLEARRLRGDAERSPLVERRSSHALSTGLAWRF
jgi:outer membrane scaffolding protein for murein synthesis (MipA/OmpV family)